MITLLTACGGGVDSGATDSAGGDDNGADSTPLPTSTLPTVGVAEKLESLDDGDAHSARMALDDRTTATVFISWNQSDGVSDHLYFSSYVDGNGSWGTPERLDDAEGDVGPGELVVDNKGSVTIAWPQEVNGQYRLWAAHYNLFERNWRDAEVIDGGGSGDVGAPRMVTEAVSRYVVAVWPQADGSGGRLWANRYNVDLDGSWDGATAIDAGGGNVAEVVLVIDGDDAATAIWTEDDGSRYNLWARRHDAAGGWGSAVKLDSEDLGDVSAPRLAVDVDGNLTAIWLQNNGSIDRLWSARYTGSAWDSAQLLSGSGSVTGAELVVDADGDAMVAWVEQNGIWNDVWSRRYSRTDGVWQSARQISSAEDGSASLAGLNVDAAGNILALWRESDGGYFDLWAARYTPASGWAVAVTIEALDDGDAALPVVAINPVSGDLTAVWRQNHEGGEHLVSSRYSANGDQWSEVSKVEAATESGGDNPLVVVDSSGVATVVWQQPANGHFDLWGNRF